MSLALVTTSRVAHTKGQTGVVLDAKDGRVLCRCEDLTITTNIPRSRSRFVEWDGRTRLVHGVAWNRLDVSDAETR